MTNTYLVPLAIPLLLFKADLGSIIREGGKTLIAFICGAVGTLAGVAIGLLVLDLGVAQAKLGGHVFCHLYRWFNEYCRSC